MRVYYTTCIREQRAGGGSRELAPVNSLVYKSNAPFCTIRSLLVSQAESRFNPRKIEKHSIIIVLGSR